MKRSYCKYIVALISVLLVFLATEVVLAQTGKPIVVIDPAHGGEDSGVLGINKTAEKDLTLAIALILQKELSQDQRIQVVLTRSEDKTVSLKERKDKIKKWQPALVLSLHVNAGFGRHSSGFELYYPGFKGLAPPPEAKKENKLFAPAPRESHYLSDAVKLAHLTQKNLDILFPRQGRGLREAMTPLMEELPYPVLVVELGFITNPEEKKKITDKKVQADIARAMAKSIRAFF